MFSFIANILTRKKLDEEYEIESGTEYYEDSEEEVSEEEVSEEEVSEEIPKEKCEEDYAKEIIELDEEKLIENYTKTDYYKLIYLTILGNLPNNFSTKSKFSRDLREYMSKLPFDMYSIKCLPFILQNVDYICKNHRQGCGNPGIKNFIKWKQTSIDDIDMLYNAILVILQKYKK